HERLREEHQVATPQLDRLVGSIPAGCALACHAPVLPVHVAHRQRQVTHGRNRGRSEGFEEARERCPLRILPGMSGMYEEVHGAARGASEIDQEDCGSEPARADNPDGTVHRAALTMRSGAVKVSEAFPTRSRSW